MIFKSNLVLIAGECLKTLVEVAGKPLSIKLESGDAIIQDFVDIETLMCGKKDLIAVIASTIKSENKIKLTVHYRESDDDLIDILDDYILYPLEHASEDNI